jgi:hypothetical protein
MLIVRRGDSVLIAFRGKKAVLLFLIFILILFVSLDPANRDVSGQTIDDSFTVIHLGDTQSLSADYPNAFNSLTKWIVDFSSTPTANLKMVIHTGDIQDGNTAAQWTEANDSMSLLLNNSVPYVWTMGNHDLTPQGVANSATIAEKWAAFNTTVAKEKAYWADSLYGKNTAAKFSFTSSDLKCYSFMVIDLEYDANSTTISWMENLIRNNPDYNVIIGTHEYKNQTGGYQYAPGDSGAWSYAFSSILDKYPQIFMTMNGHQHYQKTPYSNISVVNGRIEEMFNPQDYGLDSALARIYRFNLKNNRITVETVNTNNKNYLADYWNSLNLAIPKTLIYTEPNPAPLQTSIPNIPAPISTPIVSTVETTPPSEAPLIVPEPSPTDSSLLESKQTIKYTSNLINKPDAKLPSIVPPYPSSTPTTTNSFNPQPKPTTPITQTNTSFSNVIMIILFTGLLSFPILIGLKKRSPSTKV